MDKIIIVICLTILTVIAASAVRGRLHKEEAQPAQLRSAPLPLTTQECRNLPGIPLHDVWSGRVVDCLVYDKGE